MIKKRKYFFHLYNVPTTNKTKTKESIKTSNIRPVLINACKYFWWAYILADLYTGRWTYIWTKISICLK